jgi:hypothetical protein
MKLLADLYEKLEFYNMGRNKERIPWSSFFNNFVSPVATHGIFAS